MATATSPSPAAVIWGDTLNEVSFINPNAAQARSRRRVKLTAARARLATLAAAGAAVFSAGDAGAGGSAGGALSEREERKQQRMLRNRESAALSRKRKSDRIGELEIQVKALQDENRRLRQRVDRQDTNGGGNISVAPPSPRAAWAPTNVAAIAALSATSVVIPSAPATAVVPTTPPINSDNDLASNNFHHVAPDAIAASGCSATASSCSSPASPANACFNISRPAVFA